MRGFLVGIIRLEGLPTRYEAGQKAGDFIAKQADAAANFACGLYKSFTGTILGGAIQPTAKGLFDTLCSGRAPGLPAPPSQPFSGGQCGCVLYRVEYTFKPKGATSVIRAGAGEQFGKIGGIFTRPLPGNAAGEQVWLIVGTCVNGVPGTKEIAVNQGLAPITDLAIVSVVRVTAGTDTCGNPPVDYPINSYRPPAGWERGQGEVVYNDGVKLTVPLVYAPITPTLNVSPTFNVNVGGLNFKFDLGGVTLDLGAENQDTLVPRDRLLDDTDSFDRVERKLDELQRDVDRLVDTVDSLPTGDGSGSEPPVAAPPDADPELDKEPQPEESKEKEGVERLKWVKIVLTSLPDKTQFGAGAPNCVFAGWLEFKSGKSCHPRQQINFQESIFLAPPGADGYAYTLTNGAKGRAIEYRKKETV